MTEKKWSKGPWHVGMRSGNNANTVYLYDGEDLHHDSGICSVYGIPLHVDVGEAEGSRGLNNAHLIAAAPELYEALEGLAFGGTERQYREMMNDAPCHNGITDIDGCSRCGREIKAIRAMAKARGESQ